MNHLKILERILIQYKVVKSFEKKVQLITDKHIATVDEKISTKEKEIMTI